MDRIIDYVRLYSTITFDQLPFNEVDNLVFCGLSYWKFPEMNWMRHKYTLRECFEALHGEPVQMMTAETDETMRILIESITGLASAMGITIAAVGVENEAQYQLLRQMGIKKMQGYLFSRPVRAEELDPILQKGIIPFIPS